MLEQPAEQLEFEDPQNDLIGNKRLRPAALANLEEEEKKEARSLIDSDTVSEELDALCVELQDDESTS